MKLKTNIIVTGTLGYDYIMDFNGRFADRIMPDKIHSISLSFLADKLTRQFGGTAGNIAYSLKLLGSDPVLLCYAGNDFGPYREFLAKNQINITHIGIRDDETTSSYFVITDKDDNQIGSFYVGATKYAQNLSISGSTNSKGDNFVVIAPNDPKAMIKYVADCQKLGLRYIYDPAFQIATFSPEDLKTAIIQAEILIGNDYEIALIEEKLGFSHEELIVSVPVLITTLGAKGSVIENRKAAIHIQPAKVKSVLDPTGAGDAYRSGFLAGYLRGFDLVTSGQMGSIAAAYTVEKYGTVTHTYTKKSFIDRYTENYQEKLSL